MLCVAIDAGFASCRRRRKRRFRHTRSTMIERAAKTKTPTTIAMVALSSVFKLAAVVVEPCVLISVGSIEVVRKVCDVSIWLVVIGGDGDVNTGHFDA